MSSKPILYKDTLAMPKSELHSLLTEAAETKDPNKANDLRKKAERSYKDTEARYQQLMGTDKKDRNGKEAKETKA